MESDAKHDAEVAQKAKPVSERVQILDIRLLESRSQQTRCDETIPRRLTQNIEIENHLDGNRLEVFPRFVLTVKRLEGSPEELLVRIEARFAITYSIESRDDLTDDNYEAFAQRNGVYNAWPYWREFVQSSTVRMGLPALTLPVYKIGVSKLHQDASLPPARARKQIASTQQATDEKKGG